MLFNVKIHFAVIVSFLIILTHFDVRCLRENVQTENLVPKRVFRIARIEHRCIEMDVPGLSLFQGAESLQLNTSTQQRIEEQDAFEDQQRRNEEVTNKSEFSFGLNFRLLTSSRSIVITVEERIAKRIRRFG